MPWGDVLGAWSPEVCNFSLIWLGPLEWSCFPFLFGSSCLMHLTADWPGVWGRWFWWFSFFFLLFCFLPCASDRRLAGCMRSFVLVWLLRLSCGLLLLLPPPPCVFWVLFFGFSCRLLPPLLPTVLGGVLTSPPSGSCFQFSDASRPEPWTGLHSGGHLWCSRLALR